jgi:UDP-2,3-diacylglucosamine hydrolase
VPAEDGLAIVAGRGLLPRLLAEDCARRRRRYRVVVFEGIALDWLGGHPVLRAAFEKPGRLFAELHAAGCRVVTFAGGMKRPSLNPLRFDAKMVRLAPRLLSGVKGGDDATLRLIAGIFEAEGLTVRAPQEILRELLAPAGVLTRARPSETDRADAARAARIVRAVGRADVGQGVVVAGGLCLGVETIQGTDALLEFVARTADDYRDGARGVLLKAPKPGQDWRVDLPSVGPATVEAARAAGLAGIAVEAGGVLILDRAGTVAAADAAGLFLWGREAQA